MHKKVTQRVGWVENPTSPQAVCNVGFINPTYAVIEHSFVSLFLAFPIGEGICLLSAPLRLECGK